MTASVIDSLLFGDQFSTAAMRAVFSDEATVEKWLAVEAALARAEADCGIVPDAAADAIEGVADVGGYDLASLKAEMDRTKHPIVPLVRAMAARLEAAGETGAAGYVHWGATTQDIMDTGTVLQIRDAMDLIGDALDALGTALADQARRHRTTPMAGRTHGQQALPITFGFKAAVWLAEVRRHEARLGECRGRVLVGQFSGAVGTLASLDEDGGDNPGLAVQERLFARLGLGQPLIAWHTARDGFAEFACVAALAAGTAGKIANEVYQLQKTEIGELEEPNLEGNVGSSTMPHKRNPAACETVVALSRAAANAAAMAIGNTAHEHERFKIGLQAEREFMPRLCCHAEAALRKTAFVVGGLRVNAGAMRRNLDATHGLLLSEAVMMKMAGTLGRQKAHDIVHAACARVIDDGVTLAAALSEDAAVAGTFDAEALAGMLAPDAYTGLAAEFVDRVLAAEPDA